MKSVPAVLAILFGLAILPASGQEIAPISTELSKAAGKFDVQLLKKTFASYQYGPSVIEGAIIDGYQNIAPTDYGDGVDMAVIRYHSEEAGLPDGFYLWSVRTEIPVTQLGDYVVISQLKDFDRKVVFEQKSLANVFSLKPLKNIEDPGVIFSIVGEAITDGVMARGRPSTADGFRSAHRRLTDLRG